MFKKSLIALALVGVAVSWQAQAVPVTPEVLVTTGVDLGATWWAFNNTGVTGNDRATDLQARIQCMTGSCGLVTYGDFPNSNPSTEVAALNAVLSTDVDPSLYGQILSGSWGEDGGTFTSAARYVMFKFGDAADAWFENLTGGSVTFTFNTAGPTYTGGGLSHVTTTEEVPVPGTLGLLGLGLVCLGLIRRKQQA
jgi:hypothetical protein